MPPPYSAFVRLLDTTSLVITGTFLAFPGIPYALLHPATSILERRTNESREPAFHLMISPLRFWLGALVGMPFHIDGVRDTVASYAAANFPELVPTITDGLLELPRFYKDVATIPHTATMAESGDLPIPDHFRDYLHALAGPQQVTVWFESIGVIRLCYPAFSDQEFEDLRSLTSPLEPSPDSPLLKG